MVADQWRFFNGLECRKEQKVLVILSSARRVESNHDRKLWLAEGPRLTPLQTLNPPGRCGAVLILVLG